MLNKLFGSRTRLKLLTLLLSNPERSYFVREITRRLDERINSIRRELANLESIGLVTSQTKRRKRFYSVNVNSKIYPELRALILKVGIAPEERVIKQIADTGNVKLAVLTGLFTKYEGARTDLLIVGDIDRNKLKRLVESLENDIEEEIDYTVMPESEFTYRVEITDTFIKDVFAHEHVVVVDRLKIAEQLAADAQGNRSKNLWSQKPGEEDPATSVKEKALY